MQIGALPRNKKIIVLDSGVGGLTIARGISAELPTTDLHYIADQAGFPYGDWPKGQLAQHIGDLLENQLKTRSADACVIACNTASIQVLDSLRGRFKIPFVGTVPAVKPAVRLTRSGQISLLATPATAESPYLKALIERVAPTMDVRVVACTRLARLAERHFRGQPIDPSELAEEIRPAFAEARSGRTDTVVLGCTHYPLLLEKLEALAPWPVQWLDPAAAVAAQVMRVLYPIFCNWGLKPLSRQISFQSTAGHFSPELMMRMKDLCENSGLSSSDHSLRHGTFKQRPRGQGAVA